MAHHKIDFAGHRYRYNSAATTAQPVISKHIDIIMLLFCSLRSLFDSSYYTDNFSMDL